ncbi:arylsulfatase [Phenylobacterium montanum]|uniref:Arylsulfatase n=1 Tax=Phenylobacterium montanum TaxID=2823693 RepID=A0A975G1B5_9CAUL|nr:arylsulfatase [Caulobacter sp. S6]QUD88926.1 arylsulfatase [Caulobacter sp. S6]
MSRKPPSGEDFHGVIGRTYAESKPWWPPAKFKDGAPNVVMVVLDDTGFSHFGCYGSSIETPNIDALAAGGLRFTSFHTTALCSPTRACLLTGRNHHAVGMRAISNFDTGFPNMRGAIPRSAATLAEILRDNGYATFATGKWHLAPMAECSAAGPYANWPLQKGFDRYYGFLQGETDQFFPELTSDNHFVDPPGGPEDGYHVSEDIVDKSAGMVRDLTSLVPERPFFLYLAFGAMHSPHQAPQAYLDKYRGKFDAGWDVVREEWFARQQELGVIPPGTRLAPRNPGVRPWTELSTNEQRFACRLQEAFAAMLEHTDHQIGRLVEFLKSVNQWDNTLFIVMSDNGASQEGGASGVLDEMKWFNGIRESVDEAVERLDDIGGPNSHCNIPWGWAQAGNTPLKWYKQNTHGGGVRDPLVMHWPKGIAARGEIRDQFCHVIDIAPTLLDVLGLGQPEVVAGVPQMPVHGVSLKPSFADGAARIERGAQYFEMLGHRGIWKDSWKAVTHHEPGTPFEEDKWELYHLAADFSEFEDLAEREPERLKALIDLWWEEADRHGALPLDDRGPFALFAASRRPGLPTSRSRFVYHPPISHIVTDACPPVARGWTTRLSLEHPEGAADGALVARGSINSGWALLVKDGRLVFDYNEFHHHARLEASAPLAPGAREIVLEVVRRPDGGGDVRLSVDGETAATGALPRLLFMISSTGMDIGRSLSPVTADYAAPFTYPGRIRQVVFEIPDLAAMGEVKAFVRAEMTRQ